MLIALLGASLRCGGASERAPTVERGQGTVVDGMPNTPEVQPDLSEVNPEVSAPGSNGLAGSEAFGFERDVYPLFVSYCGECHSENGPYHDIASPDLAIAYADAVEFAERVLARIRQGNMPPACVFDDAGCVPSESLLVIERWVNEGMPE